MRIPGFTAEAAVFRSSRQYRRRSLSSRSARGVVPQQSGELCMDWECLSWCEAHNPYPETCYSGCQVPCDPNAPPEMIPAPG